jgi:hypothetical protein
MNNPHNPKFIAKRPWYLGNGDVAGGAGGAAAAAEASSAALLDVASLKATNDKCWESLPGVSHTQEQTEWTGMDHHDETMSWSPQSSVGEKRSHLST